MQGIGPADPARAASADELLPAALEAAEAVGVTRLADLTRLDRIGLPVWQAVRPLGRALSVHQGKGASDTDAKLGALLEAVESHYAEVFVEKGPACRFDALPASQRAPLLADFAARDEPPDSGKQYHWVAARLIGSGEPIHLPFDLVSLDFTRAPDSPFERSSNGLATGATEAEAAAVALQEIVERDAVTEWQAGGLIACMRDTIRIDSIPFDWLGHWRERLREAAILMRFYRVPSLSGTPVLVCELNDPGKQGAPYGAVHGRGCHPDPEIALFKAFAEAVQSRVTLVAGAREDLPPSLYAAGGGAAAFALPLPPGARGVEWDEIGSGPRGAEAIAEALAQRGYDRSALLTIARPRGFAIVRAFVCGLGSVHRRRRAPLR